MKNLFPSAARDAGRRGADAHPDAMGIMTEVTAGFSLSQPCHRRPSAWNAEASHDMKSRRSLIFASPPLEDGRALWMEMEDTYVVDTGVDSSVGIIDTVPQMEEEMPSSTPTAWTEKRS